jgi:DMSO/TMAO reductase YedYZ molybdopterin-dependent catalytic subunit
MKNILSIFLALLLLAACFPTQAPTSAAPTNLAPTAEAESTRLPTAKAGDIPAQCDLPMVVAPTLPAVIPAYTELDETTGLHMTGKVQVIDLATYRLAVNGKVDHPLSLSLDDLRCMPKITATSDLTCYGVFNDSGTWSGVPIKYVLEQAGIQAGAKTVEFKSGDDFKVTMTLAEALVAKSFLAYEMEGKPLPILHGFPLRAVFPDEPGGRWVKWLVEITIE